MACRSELKRGSQPATSAPVGVSPTGIRAVKEARVKDQGSLGQTIAEIIPMEGAVAFKLVQGCMHATLTCAGCIGPPVGEGRAGGGIGRQ